MGTITDRHRDEVKTRNVYERVDLLNVNVIMFIKNLLFLIFIIKPNLAIR